MNHCFQRHQRIQIVWAVATCHCASVHIHSLQAMEYFDTQKKWANEVMKKDRLKRASSNIVKAGVLSKVNVVLNGQCMFQYDL